MTIVLGYWSIHTFKTTLTFLAFHITLWKNLNSNNSSSSLMHYIHIVFFFPVGAAGGGSCGQLVSVIVSQYCLFMAISMDHGCIIMPWMHNRLSSGWGCARLCNAEGENRQVARPIISFGPNDMIGQVTCLFSPSAFRNHTHPHPEESLLWIHAIIIHP